MKPHPAERQIYLTNAQTQGSVEICVLNAFPKYLTTSFAALLWAYKGVREYPLTSL